MDRCLELRVASAATFLLLAPLGGCRDAASSSKTSVATPDKSRTAFFDRPAALASARASSAPSPLIVLLSTDPWKMVIGSDSPTFALYSDGTVLFRRKDGFASVKLTQTELTDLTRTFDDPQLAALAGSYQPTSWTDQPDNDLILYNRKVPLFINIYGSLDEAEVRKRLPDTILAAFDRLRGFSAPRAKRWLPASVEVMVSPYEYAPDPSIVWPKRWPVLSSPTTQKRGESFSIFVPSSQLSGLRKFLATRMKKGAVEIDRKKWSAAIRMPFPHEELWMAPNDEIAGKEIAEFPRTRR